MKIKLDGNEMDTEQNTHKYLKEKFEFPDYYGENLDSLWDLLSEKSDELEIELYNEEEMFAKLGGYSEEIISLFEDLTLENENIKFTIIIE